MNTLDRESTTPDKELTREEVIARNLRVVEAHFHNENPENVEKAIDLYGDTIRWEAPSRGVVMDSRKDILSAYQAIFRTVGYKSTIPLCRFATEQFVFDDQVAHVTLIGDEMPNVPFPKGTDLCVRLAHVFEMKDGKIIRETAYEIWRKEGAPNVGDYIPKGAHETVF